MSTQNTFNVKSFVIKSPQKARQSANVTGGIQFSGSTQHLADASHNLAPEEVRKGSCANRTVLDTGHSETLPYKKCLSIYRTPAPPLPSYVCVCVCVCVCMCVCVRARTCVCM